MPTRLPRVITDGRLFRFADSGRPERFLGFNFLRRSGDGTIGVVNPGIFDRGECRRMLDHLASRRFNLVRIFAGGPQTAAGSLDPQFIMNLAHFIEDASDRGVYVLLVAHEYPIPEYYSGGQDDPTKGYQRYIMEEAHVLSKGRYTVDLLTRLAEAGASLESLFAIELFNEMHVQANAPPFLTREGPFRFRDREYDMSSGRERRELIDDAWVWAADLLVQHIRQVDPFLLVSTSVVAPMNWGRGNFAEVHLPPGYLDNMPREDPGERYQIPLTVPGLARSRLSFVDLHYYVSPQSTNSFREDVGWSQAEQICNTPPGKPFFCSEFGANRLGTINTLPLAVDFVARQRDEILLNLGLGGATFWIYDEGGPDWTATEGNGAIFDVLSQSFRQEYGLFLDGSPLAWTEHFCDGSSNWWIKTPGHSQMLVTDLVAHGHPQPPRLGYRSRNYMGTHQGLAHIPVGYFEWPQGVRGNYSNGDGTFVAFNSFNEYVAHHAVHPGANEFGVLASDPAEFMTPV